MTESQLLYEVMRELGKYGYVTRCNSGSVRLSSGRRFNGMPKGFSDVMFIRNDGIACFVERKAERGRVSPEQARFIERMQALNARAGIARSIDDALAICELTPGGKATP